MILLVAAVAVIVAALGLWFAGRGSTPEATPTATPSAAATERTGGIAFDGSGGLTGYWRITDQHWTATTVTLSVELFVDSGRLGYEFYAYDNAEARVYDPLPSGTVPQLQPGRLMAGESVHGILTFDVSPREMTLVLASTVNSQQVSGLPLTP